MSKEVKNEKNVTVNRKARFEYHILQTYEAGLVLVGTEVKALRQNKANLTDAYAAIRDGEVWLLNAHIGVYDFGNINNHEPLRERKLLLNFKEIKKLKNQVNEKGNTLIPLRIYFTKGKAKLELAVAKGKKMFDKREDIKKKDQKRDLERSVRY
ncbi:MAG: SsrA-binding protein SmpB [Rhodothermaceae bacterium]